MLIFSYPIEVRLAINEFPPPKSFRGAWPGIQGMSGVYTLTGSKAGCDLRYSGRMTPDSSCRPWWHVDPAPSRARTFAALVMRSYGGSALRRRRAVGGDQ